MENILIITLIQERIADAFNFSTDPIDSEELDRDVLFEMLNAMNDIDPSFQLDDIIKEAEKVGMTAEEVHAVVMEVCDAYKQIIYLLKKSPDRLTDGLLESFMKYTEDGQRAKVKMMLN
ncbi:hypothetical protein [Bacillus toyonensis]|uniref:hypothetical protein n=1 Tax=Bacillus toyonensis TaxID=155322 RepID=UPI002405749A|nr:hypothetical protein [Bacillus toyonensis]MDF9450958.1 hypothetical protein [Bacillus toyonensis]MDG1564747.1 hypothetical protein [Bacillus toyonensis]